MQHTAETPRLDRSRQRSGRQLLWGRGGDRVKPAPSDSGVWKRGPSPGHRPRGVLLAFMLISL